MELQLLQTELNWDDVQLHKKTERKFRSLKKSLLEDLNGYSVLFAGPSGTGKTMVAALLGKALKKDVVYVNLSLLISKYIGETEKNLSKVFKKANAKNYILFFDEADAIFGKRTEVKDAHDKYANQEISYLMQLLNSYQGIAIVSLNKRKLATDTFKNSFTSTIRFRRF